MAEVTHEQWAYSNVVLGRIKSVRVIEVVEVVHLTGLGLPDSLARDVTEWFLPDGTQIGTTES
jgi:hypothetical protein